jgi:hypothetical protein
VLGGALLRQASGEGEDNMPAELMGGDGWRPPSTDSRGWCSSPQSSLRAAAVGSTRAVKCGVWVSARLDRVL